MSHDPRLPLFRDIALQRPIGFNSVFPVRVLSLERISTTDLSRLMFKVVRRRLVLAEPPPECVGIWYWSYLGVGGLGLLNAFGISFYVLYFD